MEAYRFLTKEELLEIHYRVVCKGGGTPKIWDEGKLDAAMAAPQSSYGGIRAHQTVYEIAAAYWYHVSQAHPFESANKRTACVACLYFLEINGILINCSNSELYQTGINVATKKVSEKELASWLEKKSKPIN